MSKFDWIDREIEAMQLDRHWAAEVRETARTIATYPEAVTYTPDPGILPFMKGLSRWELDRSIEAMCTSLQQAQTQEQFEDSFKTAIYGIPEYNAAQEAFSTMYLDLYHKFYTENNTMFAYRLREYNRTNTLFFTRLSEMEIIEYALFCTQRRAAGERSPISICGHVYGTDANAHGSAANWSDPRSIWSMHSRSSVPILPAGGIDPGCL